MASGSDSPSTKRRDVTGGPPDAGSVRINHTKAATQNIGSSNKRISDSAFMSAALKVAAPIFGISAPELICA
jgi:hypothetical protein